MPDDTALHFSLSFSLDRDEFFRRTCPSCGRDFKTKVDPADMSSILQPAFGGLRMKSVESVYLLLKESKKSPISSCPYCNYRAESGDMLTEEFHLYLHRFVCASMSCQASIRCFPNFQMASTDHSHPMDTFGIKITLDYDSALPPRPISGPEALDMMRIDLLCCGNSIKVRDGFFDVNKCPYCGEDIVLT